MKRKFILALILLCTTVIATSVTGWIVLKDAQSSLKHETERWAVIEDVNGDRMAVEPSSAAVLQQLAELKQNQTGKWVGSIILRYDNKWGFRLSPDNVTVAEATAEGLQATIRYISENLDYWLNNWGYIDAGVTELHGQSARAFSKVVSRPISQHLDFTTRSKLLCKQ